MTILYLPLMREGIGKAGVFKVGMFDVVFNHLFFTFLRDSTLP